EHRGDHARRQRHEHAVGKSLAQLRPYEAEVLEGQLARPLPHAHHADLARTLQRGDQQRVDRHQEEACEREQRQVAPRHDVPRPRRADPSIADAGAGPGHFLRSASTAYHTYGTMTVATPMSSNVAIAAPRA